MPSAAIQSMSKRIAGIKSLIGELEMDLVQLAAYEDDMDQQTKAANRRADEIESEFAGAAATIYEEQLRKQ